MSDLLAIVGAKATDDQLLAEIARRRPNRVTVLAEDHDDSRLASLIGAIERSTGADVVGLADNRGQLRGWRFDRVVGDSATAKV
ncbi:MAG TPA: hypothetical protein VGF93_13635 [Solirubrobacteraceae bacterium]|jgi:hypothetical protein